MKNVFIIIINICLPLLVSAQQLSNYLYNAVPKEHRPANRQKVTMQELGNLIVNAKWRIIDNDKAIRELDTLCMQFGPKYGNIGDKKERAKFVYYLSTYWMGRVDNFLDSMLKYSLIFDEETQDGIEGIEEIAGAVALRKAIVYADETREYKKAYESAIKALAIFQQINDSAEISKACLQLTDLYSNLGLYKKAGDYIDSANRYEPNNKDAHIVDFKFNYSAELYLKLLVETNEPRFADSLTKLIAVCNDTIVYPESSLKFFQNGMYIVKARLNYYQKNYTQSLLDIDSAYKAIEGVEMAAYDAVSLVVFKGLNLVQLGKVKEGIELLESVKPEMNEFYTGLMLEEIYNYEKQNGNLAKALEYHEKLMEFNANAQLLNHQGQILEMEQQYNVATRDLQITRLKAQQDQYRFMAILLGIFALAAIAFIINWQRNNRRKSQKLIQQIEELTQLQIIRIEDAELKAQQLERKRIGQELHDDLASTIAGVLQFMRAKIFNETKEHEKVSLTKAVAMLESSYEKTRSKSHEIFYRPTEDYFTDILADNINLVFRDSGIQVKVEIDKLGMHELSAELKTNILYIMKEAIANIIKHAKATQVDFLMYNSNNHIYLQISDNGVGFFRRQNNQSLGLSSMKKRIEDLNGTFQIESIVKHGTNLKIVLPDKQ